MLLIFPLTGLGFLSWSQITSPSCCLVCLQQLSCLVAVTHQVSLSHAGAGLLSNHGAGGGTEMIPPPPTANHLALVAVINQGTGLCQGNPLQHQLGITQ